MDLNFALFEPFMGHIPCRVLHVHPDGSLASLAIFPDEISPCAIWDLRTYKMVWVPGTDAVDLCWSPDGKEVGILRPRFKHLIWDKMEKDTRIVWYAQQEDRMEIEQELEMEIEWRKVDAMPWVLNIAYYTGNTDLQKLMKRSTENIHLQELRKQRNGLATASWSVDGVIWERHSWPEKVLKGSCFISMDFLPFDILISPQHTIAALLWYGQDMGDVIVAFIALTESGDDQLPEATIQMGWNCWSDQPFSLFSPDSRYLVLAWREPPDNWWWVDSALDHALRFGQTEALPQVGERCIGYLDCIDWQEHRRQSIPLTIMLPTHGGLPSSDFGFGPPVFLDHEHVKILFSTGEIKTYQMSAPERYTQP